MEEGLKRLTESLTAFGSQTEELGQATDKVNERFEYLQNKPDRASARQMRDLVMSLAQKLGGYAKFLSAENDKYAPEVGAHSGISGGSRRDIRTRKHARSGNNSKVYCLLWAPPKTLRGKPWPKYPA